MIFDVYKNHFNGDSVAIRYKGQSITYSQLDKYINSYASYFAELGLGKGDKVVLSSINCPQFLYSYFGVTKIGAVIVPINVMLTVEEISYIIKNSEAKAIIVHPIILAKSKLSKEQIEGALKIKVIILDDSIKSSTANPHPTPVDEQDLATFIYTSGTTGKPKAAMLTHKNLIKNAEQCHNALLSDGSDNFICVLPMFHSFAFTACVLLPLYGGSTITILELFQPKEVVETLLTEKITVFCGVPSMFIVLLEAAKTNISFPNLKLVVSGGSSLPSEVLNQGKEKLNIAIVEGYGLSEASPVVCFNPVNGVQKAGSIGLPLTDIECKIIDDNENELDSEQVGELLVKGDNVMLGYYNNIEETNKTLVNGWLHTGDLAKRDKDGYYYIVDRKKDLIIVGGFNVYPKEVEEAIYTYPKVKECAVIGMKDDLRGEYAKAYVVLKDGEAFNEKELHKYLKGILAKFKIPRIIEFVDDLPKNSTGKILKRLLKE